LNELDMCSQRSLARENRSNSCGDEVFFDPDHPSCLRNGRKSARDSMSRASRSLVAVHRDDLLRSETMDTDGMDRCSQRPSSVRASAQDPRSKTREGEVPVDSDHSTRLRRKTTEELERYRERSSGTRTPARESMSRASRSHVRVHQTDLVRCEMTNSEKVDRCSQRSPARDSPSKSCEDEVFLDRDPSSYLRNSRTYEELDCHRERSSGSRSAARFGGDRPSGELAFSGRPSVRDARSKTSAKAAHVRDGGDHFRTSSTRKQSSSQKFSTISEGERRHIPATRRNGTMDNAAQRHKSKGAFLACVIDYRTAS